MAKCTNRSMLTLAMALSASPLWAAQKDIELNEHNDLPDVRVELVMEQRVDSKIKAYRADGNDELVQLKVGDELRICFKASAHGFVTLWQNRLNDDSKNERKKLFPAGAGAVELNAGEQVCPGSSEERWGFRVKGVSEWAEVVAHWTPDAASAWPDDAYPKAVRFARSAESPESSGYASRTLRYKSGE